MPVNIPDPDFKRIVIVGAGFAGLSLAQKLKNSKYQVVLVDKNNFHQFQPLFYQVAMAGLEPSSISFPLRKAFQKCKNVVIRVAEVERIVPEKKYLVTSSGRMDYDYLVLAYGATSNYYGNENLRKFAFPLKTVSEALHLRNSILTDFEKALLTRDYEKRQGYIDFVIVGGGPTGVEMAGALAEMKHYILPKDYKELDASEVDIYLIQSGDALLKGMSEEASKAAEKFLTKLGVIIKKNTRVVDFNGNIVSTDKGDKIHAHKVIWAAGIKCPKIDGIQEDSVTYGNRIKVNEYLEVEGMTNIYALGDLSYMVEEGYENGHPQVAQTAIQQGELLASNFKRTLDNKALKPFKYKDLGTMATIGRNRAVCDLPKYKTQGFFAWVLWLIVHLRALIGVKNKVFVLINWIWNYLTYDQSLRLIIKPKEPPQRTEE
jgi:NADH dehydrogenase